MPTSPMTFGIAGAGLLGRLLAWRLVTAGHRATLFEATPFAEPRSAAHTAAAMISPFSEAVQAEPFIFDMGLRSAALWREWIHRLNAGNQAPIEYTANGSIALAHAQDKAELLQFKNDLSARLGNKDTSQWLDEKRLRVLEPQLPAFEHALFLPQEAYLDNRRLLSHLLNVIESHGGRCLDQSPVEVGRHYCTLNETRYEFDWVLDCRGMGARNDQPGLRGVRGEVLWVETREVTFTHALRLMHPRYKLYVVPKPGHRFIIGATEIESEDRSPISVQSTLELASALYTIHPAFAEARVVETDSNLRPAFLDNNPGVSVEPGLLRINGLYRHGYLLAPAIVDDVLRFLTNEIPGEHWHRISHYHSLPASAAV